MQKPLTIQTEIRVADLLKMYDTGTAYFLCYNMAKMLKDQIESHRQWEQHSSNQAHKELLEASGYLYYEFIEIYLERKHFESLIIEQFTAAMKKTFPSGMCGNIIANIKTHYDINYVGDLMNLGRREIREAVLNHMFATDPDAVFVVAC
jgi:hypothetical protein